MVNYSRKGAFIFIFKRYADIFLHDKIFLDFLNTRHKSIKFTIEIEQDQKLFLDVLITKTSNIKITANYKKSAETGVLTNYFRFIIVIYVLLVDRLYKIKNTWSGFHNVIEKTKSIFKEPISARVN